MPPGGAFPTQAQPPASASVPQETGRQAQGRGFGTPVLALLPLPRDPGPTFPHWASASWPDTGFCKGKQVTTMVKPLHTVRLICRDLNKRLCQRMLSRAAGKQLCPGPQCMPAESQEPQQQAASLHPLAKQEVPYTPQGHSTFHLPSPRGLPARGIGDRNQRPYSWGKWANEGQGMERSGGHLGGVPSLGARVKGR